MIPLKRSLCRELLFCLFLEPHDDKPCASIKREANGDIVWRTKRCTEEKNYICQYNDFCPVGYGNESCTQCTVGSYKDSVGYLPCTSCEPTKTTITEGSNSVNDCGKHVSVF